jgi:hypothetical protein
VIPREIGHELLGDFGQGLGRHHELGDDDVLSGASRSHCRTVKTSRRH